MDKSNTEVVVAMYQRLEKIGVPVSVPGEPVILTFGQEKDTFEVIVELQAENSYKVTVRIIRLLGNEDMSILDKCEMSLRLPNGDTQYSTDFLNNGQCQFDQIEEGMYHFAPFESLRNFMILREMRAAIQLLKKNGLSEVFKDQPIKGSELKGLSDEVITAIEEELSD